MSAPFLGLRTAIYMVSDIDAAKAWYTGILGFGPYFDEPFYVGYNVAGYELGLQPEEAPTTKKPDSVVTYWGVESVEERLEQLLTAGATHHHGPQDVGDGIIVASVYDPWGNIFGMIYNPHFEL